MTRRNKILQILNTKNSKMTCQQICKVIIEEEKLEGNIARYLSGSVSSILNKLVKDGILKYADEKGIKGGYVYEKIKKVSYVKNKTH